MDRTILESSPRGLAERFGSIDAKQGQGGTSLRNPSTGLQGRCPRNALAVQKCPNRSPKVPANEPKKEVKYKPKSDQKRAPKMEQKMVQQIAQILARIGPDALEDTCTVVKRVGHESHGGIVPVAELNPRKLPGDEAGSSRTSARTTAMRSPRSSPAGTLIS